LLNQFIEKESPIYLTDLKSFKGNIDFWVFLFVLSLFSLAGIPPLSGFVAKFIVIASLVQENSIVVPLILALIGAISTFYYVRLVKIISFESALKKNYSSGTHNKYSSVNFLYINCCAILILCLFFLAFSFIFLDFLLAFSSILAFQN
jgi:NADH-quinone oxidoreductase subunit N